MVSVFEGWLKMGQSMGSMEIINEVGKKSADNDW